MSDLLAAYNPHVSILFSAVLADVLDALGQRHSALPPDIRPLRPEWKILGRAATLQAVAVNDEPEKPYAVEMACIDNLKPGDILIASTNGDRGSALWGELLSTACQARQASGVVIDGLTRDTTKILDMNYPVFAAGYSPLDSKGRLDGVHFGQPIQIGSCRIEAGDFVFADVDGIVVIPQALAAQTLAKALEKVSGENKVREELAKGRKVSEVFAEYGIL
jgi:4-hydroxy-4-methyl-2-oxoglutarate aldolase